MPIPKTNSAATIERKLAALLGISLGQVVIASTLTPESIADVRETNPWYLRDVISVEDIEEKEWLILLFKTAAILKTYVEMYPQLVLTFLKESVIATQFYEPSTRTRLSFESAAIRMGAHIMSTPDGARTSSSTKGETLADASKMLALYANLIVQRHPSIGSARIAADASSVPVVNAGDGAGEHPTQALLDLFTILEKLGDDLEGKVITFVGDIKNSRTVHSLALLLRFYPGVQLLFVNPPGLELPNEYRERLQQLGIRCKESHDFIDCVRVAHVLYMTRVQKERFVDPTEYEKYKLAFVLDEDIMKMHLPDFAWVMHPLPRVDEIAPEVDKDPRALYLGDQPRNGLFVRMALLLRILTMPVQKRKKKEKQR